MAAPTYDTPPSPAGGVIEPFSERIKWETFARVIALTSLLFFGIAMDLGFGPQPIAQLPEVVLYKLITTFYILSFVALLATYLIDAQHRRALAWASLTIDVALAGSLVTISHGIDSVFLFALPLTVVSGAALLERPGAVVAATCGAVLMVLLALVDVRVLVVDMESVTVAWLRALGPRVAPPAFEVLVQGFVQVAALYATAMLSSQLVVELNRERRRTVLERRELTALRVRYEDVWSSLPEGLATVSKDGVILTANPALLRILDQSASELINEPVTRVLPELTAAVTLSGTTAEIRRSQLAPTSEITRRRPELTRTGTRTSEKQVLTVRSELLRDAGTQGRLTGETLLILRDVTNVRRREQAHLNRERLATVGAMAMAIAHEIRNPLASISGAVQMLAATLKVDEEDAALMQIAVRETQQLSDWIGEFLDYAKPGTLHLEPVDLGELVREKVAALEQDPHLHANDVKLTQTPTEGDTILLADRKSLSSLVWNLLRNAVDAVAQADRREVSIAVHGLDQTISLLVADSGAGVPTADRAQLFQPFFTTRAEGTGLGLATVRRVLDNQRGRIEVGTSHLGGALFAVSLPRDLRDSEQDSAEG